MGRGKQEDEELFEVSELEREKKPVQQKYASPRKGGTPIRQKVRRRERSGRGKKSSKNASTYFFLIVGAILMLMVFLLGLFFFIRHLIPRGV